MTLSSIKDWTHHADRDRFATRPASVKLGPQPPRKGSPLILTSTRSLVNQEPKPSAVLIMRKVGQVSCLPIRGVSDSARGRSPLQLADLEVYPTGYSRNEGPNSHAK